MCGIENILLFVLLTIFHEIRYKETFAGLIIIYSEEFIKLGFLVESTDLVFLLFRNNLRYTLLKYLYFFLLICSIVVCVDILLNIITHFVCLAFALPTHLEHVYNQFDYRFFLHRFLSLNDEFDELVSQSFGLLVTIFGLAGIDHELLAALLLSYQQNFTDQLIVQFFDDV